MKLTTRVNLLNNTFQRGRKMRRLGLTPAGPNGVYNAWKNRYQKYILVWHCEEDVELYNEDECSKCPICGQYDFTYEFEVCPVCKWEHDIVQEEDTDYKGGANKMSVNQAREAYLKDEKII